MLSVLPALFAVSLPLECENFGSLGGWTVETQSMRQLGSSYVMAHGHGVPVADAQLERRLDEGRGWTF